MSATAHPASRARRDTIVLGVVGGSGLYELDALDGAASVKLTTPFGDPSGPYTVGHLPRDGHPPVKAVFVPRHGPGHLRNPGEIDYRANIHGLKQLGVTHLLSVSAVGSLARDVQPGHLVFVDQFIDRTKARASSFFGDGVVGHVQFGEPTSEGLRTLAADAAQKAGATVHRGGTCVVMEGPAFSTRAESELYRSWGARVIGMTALPEAKLAREAEIAYALMALCTDYDCWAEEEVTVQAVVATVKANIERAKRTILGLARTLPHKVAELPFPAACENAVMTAPKAIPPAARARLDLIIGHYL